jgi:hypothetical protein
VQTIDLAYVERGVHEELVAYVADQEGYYEDEGVHVAVRNGIGWDPERLRRGASIGLGRALLHRLTGGIGWNVLSVNTQPTRSIGRPREPRHRHYGIPPSTRMIDPLV